MIDEALARKGVDKLYTWAETDEQYRYNVFMGYRPTGEEVLFENGFYDKPVYEFVKDL